MQDEELDLERLDPTLAALADSLRQTDLPAFVPNRDRLMFLCGQAAALNLPLRRPQRTLWSRRLQNVGIAISVFCMGGLTVHWASVPVSSTAGSAIVEDAAAIESESRGPGPLLEPDNLISFDQQRVSTIRSGQNLYASIDPAKIDSLSSTFLVSTGTPPETRTLSVGMTNQWINERAN